MSNWTDDLRPADLLCRLKGQPTVLFLGGQGGKPCYVLSHPAGCLPGQTALAVTPDDSREAPVGGSVCGGAMREKEWGGVIRSMSSAFINIYCSYGGMVWLQGSAFSLGTCSTFPPLTQIFPEAWDSIYSQGIQQKRRAQFIPLSSFASFIHSLIHLLFVRPCSWLWVYHDNKAGLALDP